MSIVKFKNQSGVTYAYESVSSYDPKTKQSRPKRTYLGRVDPETGEIIPTKGKRGRPPKAQKENEETSEKKKDYKMLYENSQRMMDKLEATLNEEREENKSLKVRLKKLEKVIEAIEGQILSIRD